MLKWTYECDGTGCDSVETRPPHDGAPAGWLVRTIIDRVDSLEAGATGTGFGDGRSELNRIRHYCAACRRKLARV